MTDQLATIRADLAADPQCRFSLPSRMGGKIDMTEIEATRADLAAWSERQPKAVQNAVANLDGWLLVASEHPDREFNDIDALACTARAVETLRSALQRSVAGR